jgi:hypothetical protein
LRAALEQEDINPELIRSLLETTALEGAAVDAATLEFAFRQNLERLAERLSAHPSEACVKQLQSGASVVQFLPFSVDLWKVQNIYYQLLNDLLPKMRQAQAQDDLAAKDWVEAFSILGQQLNVKVS